jgi:arsenate reductase
MAKDFLNVLFLCTGNSARSIMAEALLGRWAIGKFRAYSAGSFPKGNVNPLALELLEKYNFNTSNFRSKSWDEFATKDAPKMDFVFTVCDKAASEVCPIWPGQPMTAHWGIADPDQPGLPLDEKRRLFQKAYIELDHRIKIFTCLPFDKLEKYSLQKKLDEIGKSYPDSN